MPVSTVAEFVALLRQHQLLPAAQLDEAQKLSGSFAQAKALARELMQRGWLTPHQVNQLFQGKTTELVLGDNLLQEKLGAGGMGTVYKARHRRMDRTVAVKVIRKEQLANVTAVQRFQKEVKAAARLSHPNIVAVHDAGDAEGVLFLSMEYVEGTDLAKLVKERGPLPIASACECICQAALGLQHAHEQGVVHRDIKPHNLLLNPAKAQLKILDMGLARFNTDEGPTEGLTATGAVMGTADYIAPEQAMNSHDVDIRADIYSLGCTLYYVLTGRPPFPGGDLMNKLMKHQMQEPAAVEKLRPQVPAAVAAVVRKMMAKDPKDRYQTPLEVVRVLAPLVARFRKSKAAVGVPPSGGVGVPPSGGATAPPPEGGTPTDDEELSHTISEELSARRPTRVDGSSLGGAALATLGQATRQGASLWWRGVTQGSRRRRLTVAALTVLPTGVAGASGASAGGTRRAGAGAEGRGAAVVSRGTVWPRWSRSNTLAKSAHLDSGVRRRQECAGLRNARSAGSQSPD